MDPTRTKVIACATVIEEMLPYLPAGMAQETLDFGLHLRPGNLKTRLQEAIDACAGQYDTILLGYGLCSMAVVGLAANGCTLVTPRVDDCISIFLGSSQAYTVQSRQAPGTYYLTKGWIEVADSPFDEYDRMVTQYGEERANRLMQIMLKNYTRLVYIDTGHGDNDPYIAYTQKMAARYNLKYEEIHGSNALVLKLLHGPWDDEMLVVPPGGVITYADFRNASAPSSPSTSPGAAPQP